MTHFFFTFLYYTELRSLPLVLAAYLVRYAHLHAYDAVTSLGHMTRDVQMIHSSAKFAHSVALHMA